MPPFPAFLPMFSVITFQIPHLYLDPCLGICFWGIPGHWCLYPFLSGLILCVSHPSLYYQAFEGLLLCVQENITHALACSFCTLYQSPLPPSFCLCEAKTTALAHGQCTEIYKIQGWGGGQAVESRLHWRLLLLKILWGNWRASTVFPGPQLRYIFTSCVAIYHTHSQHTYPIHTTHTSTHIPHTYVPSHTYILHTYSHTDTHSHTHSHTRTYRVHIPSCTHTHTYTCSIHTPHRETHIYPIYNTHTHYIPITSQLRRVLWTSSSVQQLTFKQWF